MERRDTNATSVEEFHSRLFPGQQVPQGILSRHTRDVDDHDETQGDQPFFLRKGCVPTTLAVSWIGWAISHGKRSEGARARARLFLRGIVDHVLEQVGELRFTVARVGANDAATTATVFNHNPTLDGRLLWTRSILNRFALEWGSQRSSGKVTSDFLRRIVNFCLTKQKHVSYCSLLELANGLTSGSMGSILMSPTRIPAQDIARPSLFDVISFCLDPTVSGSAMLRPLGYSLLSQLALWLDGHLS